MAITLATVARNAACDAVVDLIDGGTGSPSGGVLEIKSSASTVAGTNEVARLSFGIPAFGNAATGTATANAIASDTNAVGGTAAAFTIFDADGTAILQGAVSTSGSDINLSSTTIGAGDTVSISSLTITQPAS